MSRELKRVPLKFDAPLNQTWKGFINPYADHSHGCLYCNGTGLSELAKRLQDQWYGSAPFKPSDTGSKPFTVDHPSIRLLAERNVERSSWFYGSGELAILRESARLADMFNQQWSHHLDADDIAALIKEERLWDFTRVPRTEEDNKKPKWGNGWLKKNNGYIPTPEEVNSAYLTGFGHDSINCWVCVEDKCRRLGIVQRCSECKGEGSVWDSSENKEKYESWKPKNPPRGKGFQLWENCTEGSPVSPVFRTLEELCEWAEGNATTFGSSTATKEQWMEMLSKGFVHHKEGNMIFM